MSGTDVTEGSDGSGRSRSVTIGRYMLHRQIARGGMATIHIARLLGDEGFSRICAAKRLLPEFAEDTDFVAMFMDEARIASKVHHRNVVPVVDLVTTADEVMLVQEYVHGVPLHVLLRTAKQAKLRIPPKVAVGIVMGVAAGLHAAHETSDEMGVPLNIVHRDVSPQNVMVAIDGMARLLDFGVAKATMAAHITRDGTFKGKLAYSAPEQLRGQATRQSDVYALAVVLWELLVGHRMHQAAQGEGELVTSIMRGTLPTVLAAVEAERKEHAISDEHYALLQRLDPIVSKGLAVDMATRYATAAAFEEALAPVGGASLAEVATWAKLIGKDFLEGRDKILAQEEVSWRRTQPTTRASSIVSRINTGVRSQPTRTSARHDDSGPVITVTKPVQLVAAQTLSDASQAPKKSRIVPILGALVVLLVVGLGFALKNRSSGSDATSPVGAGGTTEVAKPAPGIPAGSAVTVKRTPDELPTPVETGPGGGRAPTETAVAPSGTSGTSGTQAGGTTPLGTTQAATTQGTSPANSDKPARDRQRTTSRGGRQPAKPDKANPDVQKSTVPDAAVTAEKPSCSPPYYFEGQKKVFKPECL